MATFLPAGDVQDGDAPATTVLDAIRRTMTAIPDAVAVEFGGRAQSFAELDRFSRQVASCLALPPEAHVGILLPRCLELPGVLLGVMRAGCTYVPLDLDLPVSRLGEMITDAGIDVVIASGPAAVALPVARQVDLDLLDADNAGHVDPVLHPLQLAYTIYTSGSTGRPKGAMNTHAGLLNRLEWMQSAYPIGPGDRVLQKTPFTFDVSVWEFFWPMMYGAALVVAAPGVHRDFHALAHLLSEARITHVHFVPSMLEGFMRACTGLDFPLLRRIFCSGEALPTPVADAMLERFAHIALDNLYGPTEAAIDVSAYACVPGRRGASQPIGKAIAGVRLPVLDPEWRPLDVGREGELYIAGIALARGYVGRPALTAERFVPDSQGDGTRMYRTGDLVIEGADGEIEFLGRNDFQIKINGQRIEPGEIENRLRQHGDVATATVIDCTGPAGRRALVGYVVLRPGARIRERVVESHTRAWMQTYESAYQGLAEAGTSASENFLTWNSSYTGLQLPQAAMNAWAEEAASRILRSRPRVVYEIGCGSGLIALRIVDRVDVYAGIDPSARALDYLRSQLDANVRAEVRLGVGSAHEAGLPVDDVDVVVLNSVAQYFPDASYLDAVLTDWVERLKPRRIFIGDVRDLRLLDAFNASVRLGQGGDPDDIASLRQWCRERREQESELLLDPAWFIAWATRQAGPVTCEFFAKQFGHDNELSRFRFDVVLHVGHREPAHADTVHGYPALPAADGQASRPGIVRIEGVPLAQCLDALALDERLRSNAAPGAAVTGDADAMQRIEALADASGARVAWRLDAKRPGRADAWILPRDADDMLLASGSGAPGGAHANLPLRCALGQAAEAEFRPFLADALPAYMVPERFVVLEAMPLNSSGKLDRRMLPSPWRQSPATADASTPADALEAELHAVWAELLSLPRVPLDRSMSELGGDSILLAQMAMQCVTRSLPVDLAMAQAAPSIKALADAVRLRRTSTKPMPMVAGTSPDLPPFSDEQMRRLQRAAGADAPLAAASPLRPWLAGMLLETMRMPAAGINLEMLELQLHDIDPGFFRRAWADVMARHPWLRTCFSFLLPGRPAQLVVHEVALPIEVEDWSDRTPEQIASDWQRLRADSWRTGLRIDRAPLMRMHLVRLDERRWRALWVLHHAITDGWSYALILADWLEAYRLRVRGSAPQWLVGGSDPAPFDRWLQAQQGNPESAAYWRDYLRGMDEGSGRASTTLAQNREPQIECTRLELGPRESHALRAACGSAGLSLAALLEQLLGDNLCRLLGRQEVCLGVMFSLRHPGVPGAQDVAGPLLTVLPVRVSRMPGDTQVVEHAVAHARSRGGHFSHASDAPSTTSSGERMFDVAIAFENMPAVQTDATLVDVRFDSRTAMPVVLMVWPGERIRLELFVDCARVDRALGSKLVQAMSDDLRLIAHSPAARRPEAEGADRHDHVADPLLELSI